MKKKAPVALSWNTWKTLMRAAFTAYPKLWWRVAVVNILVMVTILVSVVVLGLLAFFGLSQSLDLENTVANLMQGGTPPAAGLTALIILGVVAFLVLLLFSLVGKVANWVVAKQYIQKKSENPFVTFFQRPWSYLGRYFWLSLRVFWYVLWPMLVPLLALVVLFLFVPEASEVWTGVAVGGLVLLAFGLAMWRGVRAMFANALLVHFDKPVKKSFDASLALVKGNWWAIAASLIAFVFLVSIPSLFFNAFDFMANFGTDLSMQNFDAYFNGDPALYQESIFVLLDVLYGFFVVSPLVLAFMYFLMLELSKKKKVKP